MCEGTRRYDKSEDIRIISHARSDQTYANTYIGFIQIQNIFKNNRLSVYIIIIFRVTIVRRYP